MALLAKTTARLRQRCPRCLEGAIYRGWMSRYARVVWMYFDRWAWPEETG